MGEEALRAFRDRFKIPVSDDQVDKAPYYCPADDSPEIKYIRERRQALGGYLPQRRPRAEPLQVPDLSAFDAQLKSSGDREFSTTMAFVRILTTLVRDKQIGKHVVPIVADEARTFGMEGLFRQLGIYSSEGQLYRPEDSEQLMYYREDKKGQILEGGISEAGAFSSWIAAGTAYSNHGISMIPFYIYYSMFGFQRIGDLAWAAADMQSRGFLLGGTAGRTTLAGEGLQHQDGHSHVQSSTIPNCVSYDPTFSYEVAVIIQDGLRRMFAEQENIYYCITLMNENYAHPVMPDSSECIPGSTSTCRCRRRTAAMSARGFGPSGSTVELFDNPLRRGDVGLAISACGRCRRQHGGPARRSRSRRSLQPRHADREGCHRA